MATLINGLKYDLRKDFDLPNGTIRTCKRNFDLFPVKIGEMYEITNSYSFYGIKKFKVENVNTGEKSSCACQCFDKD